MIYEFTGPRMKRRVSGKTASAVEDRDTLGNG